MWVTPHGVEGRIKKRRKRKEKKRKEKEEGKKEGKCRRPDKEEGGRRRGRWR